MNKKQVRQILKDTDFVHVSGSPEELKVAQYLKERCLALGAEAHLEAFPVETARIDKAVLTVKGADGKEREIPCRGYKLCGRSYYGSDILLFQRQKRFVRCCCRGTVEANH